MLAIIIIFITVYFTIVYNFNEIYLYTAIPIWSICLIFFLVWLNIKDDDYYDDDNNPPNV